MQIFVNGPEVVSNTREYLDRGSSQYLQTRESTDLLLEYDILVDQVLRQGEAVL